MSYKSVYTKDYQWVFLYVANLKLWFWEGHVEGDCKCGQQKHRENDHLQKRKKNISKHYDIDAHAGKLGAKSNQVNPCQ